MNAHTTPAIDAAGKHDAMIEKCYSLEAIMAMICHATDSIANEIIQPDDVAKLAGEIRRSAEFVEASIGEVINHLEKSAK